MSALIDTDTLSGQYRARAVDLHNKQLLITNFGGLTRNRISLSRPTVMALDGCDISGVRRVPAGQPIPYRLTRRAKRSAFQAQINSEPRSSRMRYATGGVGTVSSHSIS